ncbi:MAG: TonB-dependent receptor, partial [Bacteroidota bacterium]
MKAVKYTPALILFLCAWMGYAGTSGKIAGTVTDARTGEKLVAANIIVEGLATGAPTNVEGYYVILNIPPGLYRVRASLVGYTPVTQVDVRVEIDQTTTLDFKMTQEVVEGQEIVVVAQRPVVQRDVAASRANIEIAEVEKLPVSTVVAAVGLQAGVQGGLIIRGGSASETAFMVDGTMYRDERTNNPYTGVSLLSVEAVQVQTGGFSAEYGNIRSGIVNVVTKEGSRTNYSVGFQGRYAPARPKHFGPSIYDRNSYWIRPYVDDAVAWTGTQNGAWDIWTQKQYPSFGGWIEESKKLIANGNPSDDLSPEALQQLFLFQRRKVAEITKPDYDIDMTFGGPFPLISQELGDLRFFAAYRESRNMYLIPLSRDAYRDYTGTLKFTSDVTTTMKLTAEGMIGRTTGTNSNNAGLPGIFQTPEDIGAVLNRVSYIDTRIFATDYWAPTSTDYRSAGLKLSHTLGTKTYYDASVNVFRAEYNTNVGGLRDSLGLYYRFGENFYVNEAPFGFQYLPTPASGLANIRFGVGFSNSRDTSTTTVYRGRFDITSQIDKYNQFKAGAELVYTDQDIHYGLYDAFLKDATYSTAYQRKPVKGAVYLRDKLEFEGMVADIGVRLDYLNPGGDWFVFDPYNQALSGQFAPGIDTLLAKAPTEKQTYLSPRVGIAFPITEDAKLFFNYGHFYQQPTADQLFVLRRSGFDNSISRIADPNAPLPRTVQYELGYEHSLADEYLARVAAYYKDIKDEPLLVTYENRKGTVQYSKYTSSAYRDIRGFEVSLYKNRGEWVQGFVNYTYDVRTSGFFGSDAYFQNKLDQETYLRRNIPQSKPIPRPYARLNLDFFTPREFGPDLGGIHPLGDWRINLLGTWSSGYYFTWSGGAAIPGIENNVQWTDYWNFDMRITKTFDLGPL